jgi:hypothetical protein
MVRGDEFPCMNMPATPARMHITDNPPVLATGITGYLKQHKYARSGSFFGLLIANLVPLLPFPGGNLSQYAPDAVLFLTISQH